MKDLSCKGAIFDLDGVITASAKLHVEAWKKTFDSYLEELSKKTGIPFQPFTYEQDYLPYVDGKPRYKGTQSFLESRDIDLPYGLPSDPPGKETICGIGNQKNEMFRALIEEKGVEVFESSIELIKQLKKQNIKVGVASSSQNCSFILKRAGLIELFETIVDGITAHELGLKGKPNPDIFIAAAKNMGLHPSECMVFEDALAGVEAGRNGNFALVVGIARKTVPEQLIEHGADIVVKDLKELTLKDIENWFKTGIKERCWNLTYFGFDPPQELLREALTTVGNGYFATRGCFASTQVNDDIHYPGTYIAGLYNKLPSNVHGKIVYNNDLVNCPNWLLIQVKIGDSDFINLLECEILRYKHNLNMRDAIVSREIVFKDQEGRITSLEIKRFASMENPHIGALQYNITPQNYSDTIILKSSLDGTVTNYGVPRYRGLNSKHLEPIDEGKRNDEIFLHVQTNRSLLRIFMSAKTRVLQNGKKIEINKTTKKKPGIISEILKIDAKKFDTYTVEKFVSIYTSRDIDVEDLYETSRQVVRNIKSFDELYERHKKVWHKLWDEADYLIEGDRFAQTVVRLHIYHLLVTASIHNRNIDAGMPARGWHGEAYRGHIFWDEEFIFPFYNIWSPEITKSLLMYRYRRINAARKYARENGYQGAMYPWQSADTGEEETQKIHYNPLSGEWDPDFSRLQRHVSLSISYNIWEYFYLTNDFDFLHNYGIEMMLEIARFWASIAEYDKEDGRYHIRGVMGPDEFHEKYPDSTRGGIDDNAYTNIMTAWIMHKTIETYEYLPRKEKTRLRRKIGFTHKEIENWQEIVSKLNVVITDDGIISQFDRYMDLKELDWDSYRKKYGNISRLDRILKAEGDSPDNYKVSKQADVLMIYYFLAPGQLKHILEIMGYDTGDELEFMKRNYDFYIKRTSHGSTLSYVVHSAILTYLNEHRRDMWNWFFTALRSDIHDLQGGTTGEGIHTGLMGGTLDIIFKSFAGINLFKDRIRIEPVMPKHWKKLSFIMYHRKNWFQLEIRQDTIRVKGATLPEGEKIGVEVQGRLQFLDNHHPLEIPYT